MTSTGRLLAVSTAVLTALLLQVTVLPHFAWQVGGLGVVPDLVLLVVVATALLTDTRYGLLTGFCAGLLLDVAPPADHVAGRYALALAVVGYVVGRLAHDHSSTAAAPLRDRTVRRPALGLLLAAAAGGSFVGTSVFALTGLLLDDTGAGVGDLLAVVPVTVVLDVLAALLVVPAVTWLLRRLAAERSSQPRGHQWART